MTTGYPFGIWWIDLPLIVLSGCVIHYLFISDL